MGLPAAGPSVPLSAWNGSCPPFLRAPPLHVVLAVPGGSLGRDGKGGASCHASRACSKTCVGLRREMERPNVLRRVDRQRAKAGEAV